MGLTYSLTGAKSATWTLSTRCIEQVERLRKQSTNIDLDAIFGIANQEAGKPFLIERALAIAALVIVIPLAKKLPKGFEVWAPSLYGEVRDSGGRGAGGLLIDGVYNSIWCIDDYWVVGPSVKSTESHLWPRHYEPRDIMTENHGVYRVKEKKGRSDLCALLIKIHKFIESDPSKTFQAVFG